ncbi:triose-phosphate isomerase family protein [Helicobacter sp. 11S02629-2]|uniref:triose-phosphate isomerase n=1 Tax=Helicobacter sp. 11S02629-2 TaxID=1476195 RepID=UPI000BA728E9|nr:triose-phosphate isomerase family protein [Helicobacter sp. 11S02629-2]PAF42524.1 hypothetical protein BKH40_07720 [Helicobacter sp. 11S02629-2]
MKLIAANLKANLTPDSTNTYLKTLESTLKTKVLVFPNIASLKANTFINIELGTQDAYPVKNGAFTGTIGSEVLTSLSIKTLLLGHSEMRARGDSLIKEKFSFYKDLGYKIIFCIGEDSNILDKKGFLGTQLKDCDLDYENLVIAYEPIWAIGSGKSATLEDINSTYKMLKTLGAKKILYGGSVNETNGKDIYSITDGLLIGGFSLDPLKFASLANELDSISL